MGATYWMEQREDGREELEIESNSIVYGLLLSGPAGFPEPPPGSRKWWTAAEWLAWAGTGSEWLHVDEYVD